MSEVVIAYPEETMNHVKITAPAVQVSEKRIAELHRRAAQQHRIDGTMIIAPELILALCDTIIALRAELRASRRGPGERT